MNSVPWWKKWSQISCVLQSFFYKLHFTGRLKPCTTSSRIYCAVEKYKITTIVRLSFSWFMHYSVVCFHKCFKLHVLISESIVVMMYSVFVMFNFTTHLPPTYIALCHNRVLLGRRPGNEADVLHAHELKLYFPKTNTEYWNQNACTSEQGKQSNRIWSCLSQTYWNQNVHTTGQGKQSNRIPAPLSAIRS